MKNGRFLTTGGMGTMGYSIPAAIGAKICAPNTQVVAVCGDGAFQMTMNELATAAVCKVAVKVLVLRNRYLGLVREYQEKNCGRRYSGVRLHDYPRFDCIAGAFNMDYVECNSNEQLPGMIEEFLAWDRAALMVCNIAEENLTI